MPRLVDEIAAWASLEGVPSALAAARDGIDVLLRDRGPRRTTPQLTAESLLRGAVASARLDGSDAVVDKLRGGEGDELATAAVRLNAGLLALVPVVTRSPSQALARLHALAAAGLVEQDKLGRPRSDDHVALRLRALADGLLATTRAPAIAVAAVAHAEIATMGAFEGCNGLVARALERLLLVTRGVDPASMLVPEAGHLALSGSYRAGLSAYAVGGAGRQAWLLHCAEAMTRAAELSPLR